MTQTVNEPMNKEKMTNSWVPRLFLVGAIVGAVGCLSRPDYNLPVFLFSYIVWHYLEDKTHDVPYTAITAGGLNNMVDGLKSKKNRIVVLLIWSLIVDVLWSFYIAMRSWNSTAYEQLANWEGGLHWCSFICMLINFVLKIVCVITSCCWLTDVGKGKSKPQQAVQNMNN